MTYGQLRLQISQENPGIGVDLADSWIQDRYTQILDRLMWKRQEAESVIQVPDSYATGTIAVTRGDTAITGTGTTWNSDMDGRMIRIDAKSEFYQFTFASATAGLLDRGCERPTASGLAYRIDQAVYLMPDDARHIVQVSPFHDRLRALEIITPEELNRLAPSRNEYGTPRYAARSFDSFSDPPVLQVEFYPVPNSPNTAGETHSFVAQYQFEAAAIDGEDTGASLLPWVRPAVIKAGVRADWLASDAKKDYTGATVLEAKFDKLLGEMMQINARQRGTQQIRVAPEYRRRSTNLRPPNVRWQDR